MIKKKIKFELDVFIRYLYFERYEVFCILGVIWSVFVVLNVFL